jgi:hypothetical protein
MADAVVVEGLTDLQRAFKAADVSRSARVAEGAQACC